MAPRRRDLRHDPRRDYVPVPPDSDGTELRPVAYVPAGESADLPLITRTEPELPFWLPPPPVLVVLALSALLSLFSGAFQIDAAVSGVAPSCTTYADLNGTCACAPVQDVNISVPWGSRRAVRICPPPVTDANRCEAGTFWNTTACDYCPLGTYLPVDNNATGCQPCSAGTYAPEIGSALCDLCPRAHYCFAGASAPIACPSDRPALTYLGGATIAECIPCPPGYYCTVGNQTACPAGTYSSAHNATHSSTCTRCPAGYYGDSDALTSSTCSGGCAAGSFTNTTGSTACNTCANNAYTNAVVGHTVCTACAAGRLVCDAGIPAVQNAPICRPYVSGQCALPRCHMGVSSNCTIYT